MRIALITPGFSASSADWCIPVLRNLATGLAREHTVDVFTAAYPPRASDYDLNGVAVHSFGSGGSGRLARIGEMQRLAAAVRHAHRRRPFDVLHGFWANQGGVMSSLLSARLGVPSLLTVMAGELTYEASVGYGRRGRLGGLAGRLAAGRATAVATISEYHRRRLAREQPGLRSLCLPFGVDTTLFNADAAPTAFPDAFNLLIVGSLVPVKGHATALRALRMVSTAHPRVHLHVVGDGVLRRTLAETAERIGVRSNVTFHGHVAHDRLPPYYRAAAFCLLCSHFETSGMVVLEAAACGRLTAGSSVGSLPDITPAEFRAAPGDAGELARLIGRLIEMTPEDRSRLGTGAITHVAARFSLPDMIERYTRTYGRLAEGGGFARCE
jgi:glycosyltransferase involved in cell wall biosynthesis